MAEGKYAKYFKPAPIKRVKENGQNAPGYNFPSIYAHDGETGAGHTLGFHYMTEPYTDVYPHSHDGHEVLLFVGGDPENIYDFDAEIELQMGEECEPYTITSPTLVDIPAGLVHAPLIFKRVTKPVFFLEVTLEPEGKYKMITPDGKNT